MSGGIQRVLGELLARFGPGLAMDPRRLEALLRDLAGQDRQAIFLLVSAAREQVPQRLTGSGGSLPTPVLISALAQDLQQSLGLADPAARWAVESWAVALGITNAVVTAPLSASPPVTSPQAAAAVPTSSAGVAVVAAPGDVDYRSTTAALPPTRPTRGRSAQQGARSGDRGVMSGARTKSFSQRPRISGAVLSTIAFSIVLAIVLGIFVSSSHHSPRSRSAANLSSRSTNVSTTPATSASEAATTPAPSASEAATSPAPSASATPSPATTPGAPGIALPVTAWRSVGGASITPRNNGVFEVAYGPTYWGGVIAHANLGCNYKFSGQGRVLAGGGYGFSVYASIDSGGTPHGQGLQYDVGAGGYKDVQLPDGSESGAVYSAVTDNNWHTITIQVLNGKYTSLVDGQRIFTGDMPTACTSGLFIRLWNSTDAEFKDLRVTRL